MVTKINLSTLEKQKSENKLVFVDYFTTWCGECKMSEIVLKKLVPKFQDVKFFAIDVDEEKIWSDDNNKSIKIEKVPTFVIYKEGNEVARISNFQSEVNLTKFIEENK